MGLIKQIELSDNAIKVLANRYLLHHNGNTETPEELFKRVSRSIASIEIRWGTIADVEKRENEFYEIMSQLMFLPNSPTLMNAGTPLNQLSACFVLPVGDSLNEIFTSLRQAALIQQSGGGTGFNFSQLRPKNDPLTITGGTASGPVSFMKVFNAATEHIKHGGKRRGANMGILNVDHPDIEEFISIKNTSDALNNFNISVGISDLFMEAVEKNGTWDLINPKTKEIAKRVKASKIWNNIIFNAWQSGDPGLIFLDTINSSNPLKSLGKIESTNPCGEVPLLPFEACNLGSINLTKFINNDKIINWEKLGSVINTAIRFLDNVIEISNYIIPEISVIVRKNRKIGLGVMGWADLLAMKNIPYDSDAAIKLADLLMKFIQQESLMASETLAEERGCFPNWSRSSFYPAMKMRNATRLSIAPTGTISILADASPSIEPHFAVAFERKNILDGETLAEMNQPFVDYLKANNLETRELIEKVQQTGSLSGIESIPAHIKNIFKTALEIAPEWHLKHQVVFQKYVDNAVSKTINLPNSATVEDISEIYKTAWKEKTKGITVFRDHSRERQVIEQGIRACRSC